MNIFLDTSALFKLYHSETFSSELKKYLNQQEGLSLIIAVLTKVEFASTVWKKVRSTQEYNFTEITANSLLQIFENDMDNFYLVDTEREDFDSARRILNKCNANNIALRTLDALQLTSALKLKEDIDTFITFDKHLAIAARFFDIDVTDFDDEKSALAGS